MVERRQEAVAETPSMIQQLSDKQFEFLCLQEKYEKVVKENAGIQNLASDNYNLIKNQLAKREQEIELLKDEIQRLRDKQFNQSNQSTLEKENIALVEEIERLEAVREKDLKVLRENE